MSEAKGQAGLWEGLEAPLEAKRPEAEGEERATGRPRLQPVDRGQRVWRAGNVDRLVEEDDPARAIWEFVGRLDLSRYEEKIKAVEHEAGRPAVSPRVMFLPHRQAGQPALRLGRLAGLCGKNTVDQRVGVCVQRGDQ